MASVLPDGRYDLLLTEGLSKLIDGLDAKRSDVELIKGDAANLLADELARQISKALEDVSGNGSEQAHQQLELVNGLLVALRRRLSPISADKLAETEGEVINLISSPLRVLRAVQRNQQFTTPPELGLSIPWLFTAGKGSPSLLQEIRRELASSDSVDILVSFITVSGVRKLQDVLRQITAMGASFEGREEAKLKIRILTTTYTGATEARALDELASLPGCEVRVSLDGRRTRLHAKAWIFHRKTGFGSAYVGSANLSGAALSGGLEWTVKMTQRAQEPIFARAVAHFETLWADAEFQRYDPSNEEHRRALIQALGQQSFAGGSQTAVSFFDLVPKSYQSEMLEQLASERALGRNRNLLVAATGTGKTMVAAFDYRITCRTVGGQPGLLFVAHREEILQQALRTYREVLRDPEFGQLLTGRHEPTNFRHIFATIDSLSSRDLVNTLGETYWHTVVVDECHRLGAERLNAFATTIRPDIFLGLTATPERSDGQPISQHFQSRPDGSPAVELRLWHALDLQLLAPFEYYACDDATDFSSVPWDKPGERDALDVLVTGNDVRAKLVVNEWRRLAADARNSRAIVFCVSVKHAEFMTSCLNRAGLPAACVVGSTDMDERRKAPARLESGELCALVTVDLYNEGVDLPMVDTLLLLRPTQSPVLFQQQIGRGLRLSKDKESCLVLDFVGQHRADFRFDRLLSGLTGLSRRELLDGVGEGFGSLPPGCHIHLQPKTREQVLNGLRTLTTQNWRRLTTELQTYVALKGRTDIRLSDFLREQALDLDDVYRSSTGSAKSGWTALRREAGLLASEPGPEEAYFSRRFGDLLHIDDPVRLATLADVAAPNYSPLTLDTTASIAAQMLAYQVDGQHSQIADHQEFTRRIHDHPSIAAELAELTAMLQSRATLGASRIAGLEDTPLCLHAAYGIREILTAVGWWTSTRRVPTQAGVLALAKRKVELLFVTLDKSEGYHDGIAYRDYAISTDRFHWQSQNSAGPDTNNGRRYIESATNGWQFQLFVRQKKGTPYRACGRVQMVSVEGDRPMSIEWRLESPLSAALFREFSVLRAA
ncbi:MAG: ATP-dependent helicase [Burkholderiales bacterium PBB6]|nr:MAG: ATP-dependent helicase [Burkholderiales bacterium PBB6]